MGSFVAGGSPTRSMRDGEDEESPNSFKNAEHCSKAPFIAVYSGVICVFRLARYCANVIFSRFHSTSIEVIDSLISR